MCVDGVVVDTEEEAPKRPKGPTRPKPNANLDLDEEDSENVSLHLSMYVCVFFFR